MASKHRLVGNRVAPAVYIARNERGAEVRIGDSKADGVFSPGELLQIATAACAALSADHVLRSRLGEGFDASFVASAQAVKGEHRYSHLETQMVADLSELDTDQQAALIERALKAIHRLCTVGRTVEQSAVNEVHLVADDGSNSVAG